MYYIASKILIYFLSPFLWILFFLVLAFVASGKKSKKRFLIISAVLFLLFTNKFLLNQFSKQWDIKVSAVQPNQIYSCAIVLGGMASEDEYGKGFFNGSSDRFIQAVKLKASGRVSHLLISGGNNSLNPSSFVESTWVINELKSLNFPDSVLLTETQSRNTIENAALSKKVLSNKNLKPPYVLVTSAFHMRRALLTFKNAGLTVISHPCNFSGGQGKTSIEDFIPGAEPLIGWQGYIKEVLAYCFAYFKS